jgi:hypothetical protein
MGLFNRKNEQYKLPEKLEALLNMALKDGEITEKKLNVLRAEAAKHDISEDELDMIIESRIPQSTQQTQKEEEKPEAISSDEVNAVINANLYSESDSVTQTFQKYEILCDYTNKKLVKGDREKLHRAQLIFISSIASPADKETMLDLLAHALPYTKKDLSSKALKTATNIGFVALKAVSLTAKVATLGIAGKAVDNLEQLAQQAIVRDAEELANAWQSKVKCLFADAKELAGGMFNGDRQFKTKLSELSEQYKQYK